MLFKMQKSADNINPRISKASNNKTMLLSKCAICGTKNQDLSKNKKQVDY